MGKRNSSNIPKHNFSKDNFYDVCIIGGGPGALACLSALQEPYSLDNLTEDQARRADYHIYTNNKSNRNKIGSTKSGLNVVIIDTNPNWLDGWKQQFQALNIKVLRSPALAHPDMFDSNALLAYAEINGRQNELVESGCCKLKQLYALGQSQIGLWKLPTLNLFIDFCHSLVKRLKHTYIQSSVIDINKTEECSTKVEKLKYLYEVCLLNGSKIKTNNIILALGSVGIPNVPSGLNNVPKERIQSWKDIGRSTTLGSKVLVIGGGLTAVQAAQRIIAESSSKHKTSCQVTICSRRPLAEKHFDLQIEWFDKRTRNKCMSEFYHQSVEQRLDSLKKSRNGGSVPAIYMKDIALLEHQSKLNRIVGNANYLGISNQNQLCIQVVSNNNESFIEHYDSIVLACGLKPDCTSSVLMQNLIKKIPIPVVGGLPCITEDSKWSIHENIYVIGQLASLSIGPDSANLMGMRRAAEIISNTLNCRTWLRNEESNVLKNPFNIFEESDSDSETDSESSSSIITESSSSIIDVL